MMSVSDILTNADNSPNGIDNIAFVSDHESSKTINEDTQKAPDEVEAEKEQKGNTKVKDGQKLTLRTKLYVYVSHFLSAWGDRMWAFGIGLFLVELSPESLQLVAIYGFSQGASVLLFGAIIGDWVDNTPRLKAARLSLVLQNSLVAACSGIVFLVIVFQEQLRSEWNGEIALKLSYAVIIILTILSNLASMARNIAVERDWIVVICGKDTDMLASMSAKLRAIDLSTAILAPAATGQIIYFVALQFGAVFIAGWNVVSVFVEYFMVWKVYEQVPALKKKKTKKIKDKEILNEDLNIAVSSDMEAKGETPLCDEGQPTASDTSCDVQETADAMVEEERGENSKQDKCHPVLYKMFKSFIVLVRGWKTYMKYDVAFAGLGLAALYMTVLGFDNITVGYAYSQGISESILGILMAVGSLFGIAGTFAYPRIRKRIGLERTGFIGLGSEIFCLCFCVASVFAPGSPFYLLHINVEPESHNSTLLVKDAVDNSSVEYNLMINVTLPLNSTTNEHTSYISIGLYLSGLVTARFGLWVADLTITQLFLQSVDEMERGVVSGIQRSLNQLMDMLKFIMVIIAPYPKEYGFLVFISFAFVCLGWVLYAKFSYTIRGHLFHFEKICAKKENNNVLHMSEVHNSDSMEAVRSGP